MLYFVDIFCAVFKLLHFVISLFFFTWKFQQHVRRTEWCAVLGKRSDADSVLPNKLTVLKISRPDGDKIDEETKAYVEMVLQIKKPETFGVGFAPQPLVF